MSLLESTCKTHTVSNAKRLTIHQFRNYEQAQVSLTERCNIFLGSNGQGKSNLLEALYLMSTTRSFRGAKDKDMVRQGADAFQLSLTAGEFDEELGLSHQIGSRRQATLNSQRFPRVQDLIGRFPSVCFSSSDLFVASGEPSARRAFLDTELCLSSPAYLAAFSSYKKSVEHRNALIRGIREGIYNTQHLSPWNAKCAGAGTIVRELRLAFVAKLGPMASQCHKELCANTENLEVDYMRSDDSDSPAELTDALERNLDADLRAGATTVGPHRDDLALAVDGRPLRAFGSQGQQRTAVLSLKLAVTLYWRDHLGHLPALLLDDIMSDLDLKRREMVLGVSGQLGQVVITATDLEQVPAEVRKHAKVFDVFQGAVTER